MTKTIITLIVFLFILPFAKAQDCSEDNIPPTVKCKNDLTVNVGERIYPDFLDDGSFDNCTSTENLIFTFCEIGPCINTDVRVYYSPGLYPIWLIVQDQNGNISSCERQILVTSNCEEDDIPPVMTCFNGNRGKTGINLQAKDFARADDNCTVTSNLKFSFSANPDDSTRFYSQADIYPVSIYVTDESGNQSFCSFKLYVEQNCEEDYQLICRDDVFATVNEKLSPYQFRSYTNCTDVTFFNQGLFFSSHNNAQNIFFSEPGIYPVEITAVASNGDLISCSTSVHILADGICGQDNMPPVFSCKQDVYIKAGETLYAPILIEEAEDNCTQRIRFSFSPTNRFDHWRGYPEAGTYEITLYAHDEKGNVSTCQTQILVVGEESCLDDQLPPRPLCNGDFPKKPGDIIWTKDAVFTAYDNCTDEFDFRESFSQEEYLRFLVFEESGIYPYQTWVTDENGNTAICTGNAFVYNCDELEAKIEVEMRGEQVGILHAGINLETNYRVDYCWNTGALGKSISFYEPGIYSVTVVDQLGCTQVASVAIGTNFSYTVKDACEEGDGQIIISAFEDLGPYQYVFTNPDESIDTISTDSTLILSNLDAGLYSFTITNREGGIEELDIELSIVSFMPEIETEISKNCDNETYNVSITIEEGFENLSFEWSNGAFSKNLEGVEVGSYEVTITNEFGCTKVVSVEVVEQDFTLNYEIEYNCETHQLVIQLLPSSGEIEDNKFELITPSGIRLYGSRNSFDLGNRITNLFFGTYQAKVTSPNGCTVTTTIELDREDYFATCGQEVIEGEHHILQTDKYANQLISVTPNPSSTNVTVSIDKAIQTDLQIKIYDQLGKLHLVEQLENNQLIIPENRLNTGYYFFKIISPKGVIGHSTFLKQ